MRITPFLYVFADRNASSRPFRLMAGLLNSSEVGSLLVEHVLVDFIYFTVQMYHRLQACGGGDVEKLVPEDIHLLSSPKNSGTAAKHTNSTLPQVALEMLSQHEACAASQQGPSSKFSFYILLVTQRYTEYAQLLLSGYLKKSVTRPHLPHALVVRLHAH